MSQGNFGNLCDTDNFGDPVVLYDTFNDRWIISDFAFQVNASGDVLNPPGSFECFAVSKTGDPVSGGWNFYSINITDGLQDYPKLGVWPDGLYMSANMFDFTATGAFQNVRVSGPQPGADGSGPGERPGGLVQCTIENLRRQRVHAAAEQRPPANRHSTGRITELLRIRMGAHKRRARVEIPHRLGHSRQLNFYWADGCQHWLYLGFPSRNRSI